MKEVVIISAARTPIGKFRGAFKDTSAVALGTLALQEVLKRAKIEPKMIDQIILGNVLQAGLGQNPARQVALNAGLPYSTTAMTINQVCGSGLKAVILGKQAIQLGEAEAVIVGGIENMSQAPLLADREQAASPLPLSSLSDSMMRDGLTDAFNQEAMGLTAEAVATHYHVSRAEQDHYAYHSQLKAAEAQTSGAFTKELFPIELSSGEVISADQGIRHDTTLEKLATLKTIFKADGSVTAGNSSTINDGAAVLLLMAKDVAEAQQIPYMATLEAHTEIGFEPNYMGYAPFFAVNRLLDKLALKGDQIDLYELNEAFAAQSVAVIRDLGLPPAKVNINGGAIALGHPLGSSGARILTTLIHSLERVDKHRGIAALCVGGGLSVALAVSR